MKKTWLAFVLLPLLSLLFFSKKTSAQPELIDSLKTKLAAAGDDSLRCDILTNLAGYSLNSDPGASCRFAEQAYRLAAEMADSSRMAAGMDVRARCLMVGGKFEEAKAILHRAFLLDKRHGSAHEVKIVNALGNIAFNQGRLDTALVFYGQMRDAAKATGEPKLELTAMMNIGVVTDVMGDAEGGIRHFETALERARELHFDQMVPLLLDNLGMSEKARGNFFEAINLYLEAIEIDQRTGNRLHQVVMSLRLGELYEAQANLPKAKEYYLGTVALAGEMELKNQQVAETLAHLARFYEMDGDLEKASGYAGQAIRLADELDNPIIKAYALAMQAKISQANGLQELATAQVEKARSMMAARPLGTPGLFRVYLAAAEIYFENGQPDNALKVLQSPGILTDEKGHKRMNGILSELEYKVRKSMGDWQGALAAHEHLKAISDSLDHRRLSRQVQSLQTQFETEKKEQENTFLKTQNDLVVRQKNKLLVAAGLLALLLVGMAYLYFQVRRAKAKIAEQAAELGQLNAAKDRLFAIISHDLRSEISAFTSLGKIFNFHLGKGNLDRLKELTAQVNRSANNLSTLLDNLLQWSVSQLEGVSLDPRPLRLRQQADEIVQLFAQHAQSKGIELKNGIAPDLQAIADENSLQLIFRNLVSNALKFTPEGGAVSILGEMEGGQAVLSVADTGLGMPPEKITAAFALDRKGSSKGTAGERGTGLGLALCKEFVERNGGQISIESKEGLGTVCRFTLPGS